MDKTGAREHALQSGPLRVLWKPGKLELYWRGRELTAGPGFYSWLAGQERKASGQLQWSLVRADATSLRAEAKRIGGREIWETELLSDTELHWKVTFQLDEESLMERACAAFIAQPGYCRGLAGREPFAYEDGPARTDTTVWAGRRPVRRVALAGKAWSGLPGLAVTLDADLPFYQFFTGNGPLVSGENSWRVECVRYQNEIVPMTIPAGEHTLVDCRIRLGGNVWTPLHYPRDLFSQGRMAEVLVLDLADTPNAMAHGRDALARQLPWVLQGGSVQPPRVRMASGPGGDWLSLCLHCLRLRKQKLDLLALTCSRAEDDPPFFTGLAVRLSGARRIVWIDPALRSRWPQEESLSAFMRRRLRSALKDVRDRTAVLAVKAASLAVAAFMAGPAWLWLLAAKRKTRM